jgi:hypothetical protein
MIPLARRVWRILPLGAPPLRAVQSPEGRFHHSGQTALYTSLTPEGTVVAIRRYMMPEDPPRQIVPLELSASRVMDIRGQATASVIWQDLRAQGKASPTWEISDKARREGAQGMLYSSRSRPDLTHLVVFDLTVLTEGPSDLVQDWPRPTS